MKLVMALGTMPDFFSSFKNVNTQSKNQNQKVIFCVLGHKEFHGCQTDFILSTTTLILQLKHLQAIILSKEIGFTNLVPQK